MLDISLAGLVGAIAGTLVAAVSYHLLIGTLERRLRQQELSAEDRETQETTLSWVRRMVLTTDLIVFAGGGYWIGHSVWG